MHYLIDGYNLLFSLYGPVENHLKAFRESLIQSLNIPIEFLTLDVSIVFDSYLYPGEGSRSHFRHLEILFTAETITADDFIIHFLKNCQNPHRELIVTNDRGLTLHAKSLGAHTQKIEAFLHWLECRYVNKKKGNKAKSVQTAKVAKSSDDSEPSLEKKFLAGTDEYYLAHFEKENALLREMEANKKAFKKKKPQKQKIETEDTNIDPIKTKRMSEKERWLTIFEEKLKKGLY